MDTPIEIVIVTRGGNLDEIYVAGDQRVILHHVDFYKDTSKKADEMHTYTLESTREHADITALLKSLKGEE